NSLWRNVSIGHPVEDQDGSWNIAFVRNSTFAGGNQNLVVNRIDAYLIVAATSITQYLRITPLDYTYRRLFSIGGAAEYQHGLGEGTRDHNFIVDVVECKTMHGPADLCPLTLDRSNRRRVFLRQPGEDRDLRMGHSVGHQYRFTLAVVGQRVGLTESE